MRGFEIIKIAGNPYPVNFGTNTIRNYEEHTGHSSDDAHDKGSLTANMLYIAFFGLKDGARIEKKEFDLSIEDVADLLDKDGEQNELENSAAAKIGKLWLKAKYGIDIDKLPEPSEETQGEEEKKTKR